MKIERMRNSSYSPHWHSSFTIWCALRVEPSVRSGLEFTFLRPFAGGCATQNLGPLPARYVAPTFRACPECSEGSAKPSSAPTPGCARTGKSPYPTVRPHRRREIGGPLRRPPSFPRTRELRAQAPAGIHLPERHSPSADGLCHRPSWDRRRPCFPRSLVVTMTGNQAR